MNCLDPQFSKTFELEYYFEEVQKIKIGIYDIDNKTPELNDDDFLGGIECTLAQVNFDPALCHLLIYSVKL